MAAFIVVQVAIIRDGQSSRNRRNSVDAGSPSMCRRLQKSLFLLIDISLEVISQNLFFSTKDFLSSTLFLRISCQESEFNLGSKGGKGKGGGGGGGVL